MKKWLFCALALPTTVLALNFERSSLLYTDAPFQPAEAAGINVLTSLQAVQGYPDGSFQPSRTLNRAEFLKIALASHPNIRVSSSDADRCFPDVGRDSWFSPYVCIAKKRNIIGGYPDGTFRPENPVNYVEALKILGELYNYTAYADPGSEWWQMYVQAAINHKTILPVQLQYDRYITRGQMARLAAAYRTEHEGELELYRLMESGEDVVAFINEQQSSKSSQSESSSPIVFSESSSSAVSIPVVQYETPTVSTILLVGEQHVVGDALWYPRQRDAHLRILKIELDREARSLNKLMLHDEHGTEIASLKLDLYDRSNKTWKVELPGGSGSYVFPGGEGSKVFVVADVNDWNNGGFADDFFKIKSMFVIVEKASNQAETYQIVPTSANYPTHQTALAVVTDVQSALLGTGQLVSGNAQQLAGFDFEGETSGGLADLRIEHLRFYVDMDEGVTIDDPFITSRGAEKFSCSRESDNLSFVNCLVIPKEIGDIDGSKIIEFHADVDVSEAAAGAKLQVNLLSPGSRSALGDVRFTDGSASFTWMNGSAPLAEGKVWVK